MTAKASSYCTNHPENMYSMYRAIKTSVLSLLQSSGSSMMPFSGCHVTITIYTGCPVVCIKPTAPTSSNHKRSKHTQNAAAPAPSKTTQAVPRS